MKRSFLQILETLLVLVVVLLVPLFVQSSMMSKSKGEPGITAVSASVNVPTENSNQKGNSLDTSLIQTYGFYGLFPLLFISVISFIKFKVSKKQNV